MTKKVGNDSSHTIEVTHKQASYLVALIIIGMFFIFIAGYYWGKKTASEVFAEQTGQEALSDKIYTSLCALYDVQERDSEESDKITESIDAEILPVEQPRYYAKLIGFGAKNSALSYVQKLAARGITVNMVERQSRSARGKIQNWYQVVTQPLPKDELTMLVNALTAKDHLTNVTIIELSSSDSNERSA